MLAYNHAIKLVNTGAGTCLSTLDRRTIGNKHRGLNRHRAHLNKSFIGNKCPDVYTDKYGALECLCNGG